MIKRLSLFFLGLTLTFSFSYAVSICNDNNAVYSDNNLCKSVCSSCSIATLTTTGSVGNCDSAYFNFVYYNGKTYAVTKSLGFWTDFQNLAMPKDAGTNRVISSILPSGSVAWIGVYDSSMPNSYNTVDKSRFVYRDLSSLVYDNFASGEPNNYVDNADYGKVSVLGEHWVAMSSDGTWFDDGYHVSYGNDYKPKYAAVVEWEGPLSCVNVSTSSTPSGGQSSAVNNYCGGKIPCYICAVENSDDTSTIQQCNLSQDNKNYLCPIHQTLCTATYQDPICPTGGNYNVNTKRCEANYSCPAGGAYNANTGKCEANPS
ncbi:MAG: hypothetical protein ACK4J2_07435 [Sulfurihydrogenibium azorense]|uniref:hypothetical protein n=1 Tax=Sulfurihydrogenibium azorense TaxID=309806 RepID=UPI00391A473A